MTDVFVSYSRRDSEFVARLVAAIEARGKTVWLDTEGIADTELFPRAIQQAIDGADSFLFVITPASADSRYCASEVEHASGLGKRIVPLLRERAPDEVLPAEIRDRNWIPCDADADFEVAIGRLLTALDTDLEYTRAHTRWLLKAVEWEEGGGDRSRLLRGSELRAAEAWLASAAAEADPAPTPLQRRYLLSSRRAAARRQRALAGASLGVAAVAVALLVFALIARRQAEQERTAAQAQALAAESIAQLPADPQVSLALAIRAVHTDATPAALFSLRQALDGSPLVFDLPPQPAQDVNQCFSPTIAYSPDGRVLGEGLCSGGVLLFDAHDGRLLRRVSTGGAPAALAFGPGGRWFATTVGDGDVELRDTATGRLLGRLHGFAPQSIPHGAVFVPSVAISRDGRRIAAYDGGPLTVWSRATGARHKVPAGPFHDSLAFDRSGRHLIIGRANGSAAEIGVGDGHVVWTIQAGESSSWDFAAPSPDGRQVAISYLGPGGGAVALYDAHTGRRLGRVLGVPMVEIQSLAFSPDGTRLAVGNADGTGGVWSIRARREIVAFQGQTQYLGSIAFSPDGASVATFSDDGTARVWRAHGGEQLYVETPAKPRPGTAPDVALTGDRVLSAIQVGSRLQISSWHFPSGRPSGSWKIGAAGPDAFRLGAEGASAFSLGPDGSRLAVSPAAEHPGVEIWGVARRRLIRRLPARGVYEMGWSGDGSRLAVIETHAPLSGASGEAIGGIFVVDARSGRRTWLRDSGKGNCGGYQAVALNADGSRAAAATFCGSLAVWATSDGRRLRTMSEAGQVSNLALSGDGSRLLVGSWDGTGEIWNADTGKPLRTLVGATRGVDQAAFTPDGRLAVTGSQDQTVRVWAAGSGRELHRIPEDQVGSSVYMGPQGRTIAVAAPSGIIRVWRTCQACEDATALLRLARGRVSHHLTASERAILSDG